MQVSLDLVIIYFIVASIENFGFERVVRLLPYLSHLLLPTYMIELTAIHLFTYTSFTNSAGEIFAT